MYVVYETLLEEQCCCRGTHYYRTIGTLTLQSHSHRRDEHGLNENQFFLERVQDICISKIKYGPGIEIHAYSGTFFRPGQQGRRERFLVPSALLSTPKVAGHQGPTLIG